MNLNLFMKKLVWIVVLGLIGFALYLGSQHDVAVNFKSSEKAPAPETFETDSGIYEAVNFVKKP